MSGMHCCSVKYACFLHVSYLIAPIGLDMHQQIVMTLVRYKVGEIMGGGM